MAFGAVTILMDTLHQHFLQPKPRFLLRNKTKAKSLYRNLSSLQIFLEQEEFKAGEYDEAIKGLEAQLRDASVELRFQIEHHLRLFYLGKAMKLRLHSAKKLLPIMNRAIEDIETVDFGSMLAIIAKHFMLPVSRMPARIKRRVKSFCTRHEFLFYGEESGDEEMEYMLYEAKSLIRQELRAPSYLNKYMKQRIEARQRIRQLFIQGIKLTSYLKKELLKLKNATYYNQSKTPLENNTTSLRGPEPGEENNTVGDSVQHTSMSSTVKMVGCDDEFNMIMDNLNQQSKERKIVSIVGMGGIGKTTLAKRIYGDDSFVSHFDCRAWVTVSQQYNPTKVFKALLRSLAPAKVFENNELAEQVYKHLTGRRYLIVIDDLWSTNVLDDLMRYFQDDNNGSRMLLTTRDKNVADYACSGSNFCHTMRFLDSYESWNLFHKKVLPRRITLSPEFERIGREIVKKCKGLPLAITVAAGLLSNSNQTINEWEHIAKNVSTLSLDHYNLQYENIIHLSYTFLPHHLRLCFLSFGCFPEDYEVYEDMIVNFWVSEGFLKDLRFKRLEDVARESLQDLVDRNLVLICEGRNIIGGLSKVYQMHDIVRELALREAEKENLLLVYSKQSNGMSLRYNKIPPVNSSCISQPWSIQSRIYDYKCLAHTSNTSSFIDSDMSPYSTPVNTHFKFLRVLILHEFIDVHSTTEIMGLVHLRWLKVASSLNFHSLPLFMMWNLQKLELHNYSSCEPLHIWELPQLRDLFVSEAITLVPPRLVHHNLESIRFLDYRSCTRELFLRIPNLRILGVKTDYNINPKCKAPNWFESLVYLYKLEELVIDDVLLRWEFRTIHSMGIWSLKNFLPNLKKLELWVTRLKWKDLDVVGMLPKLEILKLRDNAVGGRKWKPRDEGFYRLKFLGILNCDLECWEVRSDHFPVLECLILGDMRLLKQIPSAFADIVTLKSIKLYDCLNSTISSAQRIQEEQQEYGNDMLAVDILGDDDFDDELLI